MSNLHSSDDINELIVGDLPLANLDVSQPPSPLISQPASAKSPAIEAVYPLSPMQAGMLFHSLYAQQPGIDIEQVVCTLHEPLNPAQLEQAWQRLADRHAVLRTSFRWEELDQPEQRVHLPQKVTLLQQDWRSLPPAVQQEQLQTHLRNDRLQGFALDRAPLMRLVLFQTADDAYQLIWTFHHILLDGRSLTLLLKEVFAIYEGLRQGQDLQLDPPHPYQAHIHWLQQQNESAAQTYWQQQLKGFTQPNPLPETVSADFGQGEVAIQLPEAATAALKALAAQCSVTPNTVLQGAWALLLSHYSGSDDIVFGATRACRHSITGAESMVGLLINTLPVRVRMVSELPLAKWLQELRSQHLSIRPYEHTPLSQVQQWTDVPAGMALFDSLVVFENYSLNAVLQSQAGWGNREVQLFEQPSYALTLTGSLDSELLLKLYYDRQRFSESTVQRMLTQLNALLNEMIAYPDRPIADFPC